MQKTAALAPRAPARPRTGVVVRKTDVEGALDRIHGIILSRCRGGGIGPRPDIGSRRQRRAVGEVLKRALVHQDASAVDRQGEDGEERHAGNTEDHDDLTAARALPGWHQYSVVMAAVATM